MNTTNTTGGPAFPRPAVFTPTHGLASVEQDGMTMRDYFAAKAMVGILTATARREDKNYNEDALASLSYTVADAMLKARHT